MVKKGGKLGWKRVSRKWRRRMKVWESRGNVYLSPSEPRGGLRGRKLDMVLLVTCAVYGGEVGCVTAGGWGAGRVGWTY